MSTDKRWAVKYDLAYDGGGAAWTQHYRHKFAAIVSAWWKKHVTSWGGSAELIDTRSSK